MSNPSSEMLKAVKQIHRGKSIAHEGIMRLRQFLPDTPEAELATIVNGIGELLEKGTPVAAPAAPPAPEAKTSPAKKPRRKSKPGEKYDLMTTLECLRDKMKGSEFTARDLADKLGMGSAQGLAPLLNSLKANKAIKRHKRSGVITWSTIPAGLKAYIKDATAEAA